MHRNCSFGTLRLRIGNVKRFPIAPVVVMVIVTLVPTGSLRFLKGLRRFTREAADVRLIVRALGQAFFCCFLRFVLQVMRMREFASTLLARSCVARVNLTPASQLWLTDDGMRPGGRGGGGGGAATLMVTVASLPLPVPSFAR